MRSLLLAAALLSGCAEMQAHRDQVNAIRAVSQCRQYGFAEGSPDLASCAMQVSQNQAAIEAQSNAARAQIGAALLMQPTHRPAARPVVTCTTMGAFTNCQ